LITQEILEMLVDASEVDAANSDYRLRVGNQVKYLVIEGGTFHSDVLSFPPNLLPRLLPLLPPGNWTQARVARGQDGNPELQLVHVVLPGVLTLWHPNRVEFLSLKYGNTWISGVRMVRYDSKLVVAKVARFDYYIDGMERETAVYQTIEGRGIGPAFLGHILEGGRVIGILVELVEGRPAGPSDIHGCRDVLQRLHALDIAHGDIFRHNFIVASDGTVKLIDFEMSFPCSSAEVKDQELATLSSALKEVRGVILPYTSTQIVPPQ